MYTKIFDSIYDGTLRKDWKALVTFQQLLILCDEEGYVDKTVDAIVSRTTIPADIINHGIKELSEPDPESRSGDEDGRRIVRINPERNWGWRIVNYATYRSIKNQEELRRHWRAEKKQQRGEKAETKRRILVDKLNAAYNRKSGAMWTYEEEFKSAEISRRAECLEELDELLTFKQRGEFFPQSVKSLLENWASTLDRARQPAQTSAPPSQSVQMMIWNDEQKRIEAKLKSIRDSYADHQTWSQKDRETYAQLKSRITQIRKGLGLE